MPVSFITKGRFANYHYIAAAAYAYSLKHGLEFKTPPHSLAPHLWPVYLSHLSNPEFDPKLLVQDKEIIHLNDFKHSYTELDFQEEWRDKKIIIGTHSIETGYFQSYRYFQGYEDKVRQMFGFGSSTSSHTCSIHFRGTDFYGLEDKHPPITAVYLKEAVGQMIGRTGCQWYFIYTDDIEHLLPIVKEIRKYFPGIRFCLNLFDTEHGDFSSMLSHAHNITANSTFSVLAATLNPNPNKVVICPHEDNFYGPGNKHLDVSDLYPPEFIRIKY